MKTEQTDFDYRWAYVILRVAIGLDLLGHGAIRLFGNFAGFRGWLVQFFANSPMPDFLVELGGWTIPPIELILGVFLLVGFKTRPSVLLASLVMLGLMAGTCVVQKWEILSLQLNYIFFYCLILAFHRFDSNGIDKGFKLRMTKA